MDYIYVVYAWLDFDNEILVEGFNWVRVGCTSDGERIGREEIDQNILKWPIEVLLKFSFNIINTVFWK